MLHSFQRLSSKPVAAVHAAVMPQTKPPFPRLTGLRHSCMSSEITLRNGNTSPFLQTNNTVNYCWNIIKLEVKDDCFSGTCFWNTSILSLETISCSWKRAACGFCHSTRVVQRMSPLKYQELRCLCLSPAFTIETPSTELATVQRRGWTIGS